MRYKHLDLSINNEISHCAVCDKSLGDQGDVIILISPMRDVVLEFCCPRCVYRYIVRKIKNQALNTMLAKSAFWKRIGMEPLETADARLYEHEVEHEEQTSTKQRHHRRRPGGSS